MNIIHNFIEYIYTTWIGDPYYTNRFFWVHKEIMILPRVFDMSDLYTIMWESVCSI